jgi:hypothetical protein
MSMASLGRKRTYYKDAPDSLEMAREIANFFDY